jgi:hypothetical protein
MRRPFSLVPRSRALDLAGAEIQQELPSAEMQPRGRPRTIPNLVQNYDAKLLKKTRKDLVDARVQFEDDRWLQKLGDSDSRAWCKPVARDIQLETVQSFYKAMYHV